MLKNVSLLICYYPGIFKPFSKKIARNLECDLFYYTFKRFHELLARNEKFLTFHTTLLSGKKGSLFYLGKEEHLKDKEGKIDKVREYIKKLNLQNLISEPKYQIVKIKQPNNAKNSLLSVLVFLHQKNDYQKEDKEAFDSNHIYFLFPFLFEDLHKK